MFEVIKILYVPNLSVCHFMTIVNIILIIFRDKSDQYIDKKNCIIFLYKEKRRQGYFYIITKYV